MKNVAVILSGCGFLDGTEIREAVLTLLELDKHKTKVTILAPNTNQHHTLNHINQEEESSPRNVLLESARIARGQVVDLAQAKASNYDAVIIPGGYGVAKNLCTFALEGSNAKVQVDVERFLKEIKQQNKPIGALCIAPALLSLLFGKDKIKVTIGNDKETAQEIEKTGCVHQVFPADQCCVDREKKIITTPAYMCDASLVEIHQGIAQCVQETLELA